MKSDTKRGGNVVETLKIGLKAAVYMADRTGLEPAERQILIGDAKTFSQRMRFCGDSHKHSLASTVHDVAKNVVNAAPHKNLLPLYASPTGVVL